MKITNRTIALVVSLVLMGALFWFFSDIIMYAVLAWVVSMLGQPLMRFYGKMKLGKFKVGSNLAAGLTLVTFMLSLVLLVMLFVPPIITQINNLAHVDYAALGQALQEPLTKLQTRLASYGIVDANVPLEQQLQERLTGSFEPSSIKKYISGFFSTAGNIGVTFGAVLFISFFFLQEQGIFVNFLSSLMPSQYDSQVKHALSEIAKNLALYFRGLLLQLLAFSLMITIALWAFGIKNALLIGVFGGLMNVIPYVGPIVGMVFGVVFTISSNLDLNFYDQTLPMVLKVVGVFFGCQLIDNNLTQPYIFSSTLKTHPLEIFFVVLVGAQIGGVMGMVLAIPGYMVIRTVASVFLSEFHIVQNLKERMSGMGEGEK
ncbi:MAG: AI-2E family transporter [Saprospiraceae bacterium]|nr:AI-2E family transporter [Saprospiraceae bacterium]